MSVLCVYIRTSDRPFILTRTHTHIHILYTREADSLVSRLEELRFAGFIMHDQLALVGYMRLYLMRRPSLVVQDQLESCSRPGTKRTMRMQRTAMAPRPKKKKTTNFNHHKLAEHIV